MLTDRDPDAWMRTKPMQEKTLHYICRNTFTVKDLPWTENRANSISEIFYPTRREALIKLKDVIEQRINVGICSLRDIELELAMSKNANT